MKHAYLDGHQATIDFTTGPNISKTTSDYQWVMKSYFKFQLFLKNCAARTINQCSKYLPKLSQIYS